MLVKEESTIDWLNTELSLGGLAKISTHKVECISVKKVFIEDFIVPRALSFVFKTDNDQLSGVQNSYADFSLTWEKTWVHLKDRKSHVLL